MSKIVQLAPYVDAENGACIKIYYDDIPPRSLKYSRFVMEQQLKRRLLATETVIFKDNNPENFKVSNLKLVTLKEARAAQRQASQTYSLDDLNAQMTALLVKRRQSHGIKTRLPFIAPGTSITTKRSYVKRGTPEFVPALGVVGSAPKIHSNIKLVELTCSYDGVKFMRRAKYAKKKKPGERTFCNSSCASKWMWENEPEHRLKMTNALTQYRIKQNALQQ